MQTVNDSYIPSLTPSPLLSAKNPALFERNGVFVSQSIFSSSMVIRDGTLSAAIHM